MLDNQEVKMDTTQTVRANKGATSDTPRHCSAPPPFAGTPPQLPHNLVHMPILSRGFPAVYLSTSLWYNIHPEQRAHFDLYPQPKLWARVWQGSKMANLVLINEDLRSLILKMTGERAKLSSLQQEKNIATNKRGERQKPPYHFLVSRISEQAYRIIANNPIISTSETTAFFLTYIPAAPCFLCTIEGFTLSVKDQKSIQESEEEVMRIVKNILSTNDMFIALLKSKLVDDITLQHNMNPVTDMIMHIEVRFSKPEDLVNKPQ